jgi:hypothetical protein
VANFVARPALRGHDYTEVCRHLAEYKLVWIANLEIAVAAELAAGPAVDLVVAGLVVVVAAPARMRLR